MLEATYERWDSLWKQESRELWVQKGDRNIDMFENAQIIVIKLYI